MNNASVINLPSRFDFNNHAEFTRTYTDILDGTDASEIILNFADVSYLDSSAIGQINVLVKKAEASGRHVVIEGARGSAAKLLKMANLQKLVEVRNPPI